LSEQDLGYQRQNNKRFGGNPYDMGHRFCAACRKFFNTKSRKCAECGEFLRFKPRGHAKKIYNERAGVYEKKAYEMNDNIPGTGPGICLNNAGDL
jgi:hypothetical protein